MEKNYTPAEMELIVSTIEQLYALGFRKAEKPNDFEQYVYASGSVANYCKARIGRFQRFECYEGYEILVAYFHYESCAESGWLPSDHEIKESRYIALDELIEELAKRGIKQREKKVRR